MIAWNRPKIFQCEQPNQLPPAPQLCEQIKNEVCREGFPGAPQLIGGGSFCIYLHFTSLRLFIAGEVQDAIQSSKRSRSWQTHSRWNEGKTGCTFELKNLDFDKNIVWNLAGLSRPPSVPRRHGVGHARARPSQASQEEVQHQEQILWGRKELWLWRL